MAFILTDELNEIRIYDEKAGETQSLFARDPSPQEQLRYEKERVVQKKGKVQNRVRQTRLKYGCAVLDKPQSAETVNDTGYGLMVAGTFAPLTVDTTEEQTGIDRAKIRAEYAAVYGGEWAGFIDDLAPWKLFLLAKIPAHIERVASVVFEGAADWKQGSQDDDDQGEGDEGN
jgi:hypothetical protein